MHKSLAITLAILLSLSSWASANKKVDSDINAVNSQVELLRKAMITADAAVLKSLTSADLSYGHSGGHVEDQAEFIAKIVTGESDFVTMSFNDQTTSVIDNIAIVRHILVATTNNRGEPGEVTIGVMLIWKKQKGKWLLLARQAFKTH